MTNSERESRGPVVRRAVLAAALVMGGVLCFASSQAFAAGELQANPTTGLEQAQVVTVTGSGLSANAYGYVLECNGTPGEPTDPVGAPFDMSISVGCSPPSLKHIVSTTATGSLSTNFEVHVSRKLGPPCSPSSVFGPCGPADSAGKRPRADAQNYPCPPSPAQQAAGVTCELVFYDTVHERVSVPIAFLGGGVPVKTPPTTTPPPTTSPGSGSTTTTAPKTPPTTAPIPATTTTVVRTVGVSTAPKGTGTAPASVVRAPSGSLAFTGLGTAGKLLALVGAILVALGLVLLFVNLRKLALWFLGM